MNDLFRYVYDIGTVLWVIFISQCVLATLLHWFRLIWSWSSEYKQTIFAIYFNSFILGALCNKPVNKIIHYMLAHSQTWLEIHMVLVQLFKKPLCVSYFTELVSGSLGNGIVNKRRKYVLAILSCSLSDHFVTSQLLKIYAMCWLVHWL